MFSKLPHAVLVFQNIKLYPSFLEDTYLIFTRASINGKQPIEQIMEGYEVMCCWLVGKLEESNFFID